MNENATLRKLREELFALEDGARALIRRICAQIDGDTRDEHRMVSAKLELFVNSADDLIHYDPSARSPHEADLRELRSRTDELILRRVELDRTLRDSRRRELETAEDVRIARAQRHAEEVRVELGQIGIVGGGT